MIRLRYRTMIISVCICLWISAILRRLADDISLYGHAAEANEMDFSYDVNSLISQIDI